jgi:hypothetical protein
MDTTAVLSIAISLVAVVVTVVTTLGGFAYKVLDGKITIVKSDAKTDIDDEERRRKEAIYGVTQTVNDHYENLRRDIGEVKADVKDLRIQ